MYIWILVSIFFLIMSFFMKNWLLRFICVPISALVGVYTLFVVLTPHTGIINDTPPLNIPFKENHFKLETTNKKTYIVLWVTYLKSNTDAIFRYPYEKDELEELKNADGQEFTFKTKTKKEIKSKMNELIVVKKSFMGTELYKEPKDDSNMEGSPRKIYEEPGFGT